MELSVGGLVALMGIPSAITGFAVWMLKRWLEKREKAAEDRNTALTEILVAQVMQNNATLSLAEATAVAVSRIPDAKCNGDMHEALNAAREMKREQRELLTKIGIKFAVD